MGKKRPTDLSEQLRSALEDCGLSRYEVARQTGISESTLSRFANGERGLPLKTVDLLARFLELELVRRRPSQEKGR